MSHARFSLVPAAYLLLVRQDADGPQVLLQLRRGTGYMDGYWACGVAGHVEPGESVVGTVVREASEEVGVGLDPDDLLPLTAMHRTNEPGGAAREQRVDFFFWTQHWRGQPAVREPAKSASLDWFPLSALPQPLVPHERVVVGLLRAQLAGKGQAPAVVAFGFTGQAPAPSPDEAPSHP